MEQTKIYLVTSSTHLSTYGGSSVHKAFLSKEDAEFYIYSQNMEVRTSYPYLGYYYSLSETTICKPEYNEKLYKKFVNKKIEEIKKEIDKKTNCSLTDQLDISDNKKEMDRLQKLLGNIKS